LSDNDDKASDTDDKSSEADVSVKKSPPPPVRRKRNWFRHLILILALGGGGYWGVQEIGTRFTHVYEYDARIAGSLITVSSRVAGWVTELHITEGDDITKGQIIVEIDARESQLLVDGYTARIQGIEADRQRLIAEKKLVDAQTKTRYRTQRSELGTAEAELESLAPQLKLARVDFQRSTSLYNKKIISRKTYDVSQAREQQLAGEHRRAVAQVQEARNKLLEAEAERTRLDVLDSEIAKLKFQENGMRAQMQRQQLDLSDRNIGAPVTGVVDKTFVDVGEYVTPGQRLALVHDPDTIWIEANVKETEVRKLRIGQRVEISVDAYPDEGIFDRLMKALGVESPDNGEAYQQFIGHVIAIGNSTTAEFALLPSPNPSGNFTKITQRLPVRIAIDQKDRKLRPGMMVEISIDIRNQ
jgi:membrane fusion protein (multidrug efflux system)